MRRNPSYDSCEKSGGCEIRNRLHYARSDVAMLRDTLVETTAVERERFPQEQGLHQQLTHGVKHERREQSETIRAQRQCSSGEIAFGRVADDHGDRKRRARVAECRSQVLAHDFLVVDILGEGAEQNDEQV